MSLLLLHHQLVHTGENLSRSRKILRAMSRRWDLHYYETFYITRIVSKSLSGNILCQTSFFPVITDWWQTNCYYQSLSSWSWPSWQGWFTWSSFASRQWDTQDCIRLHLSLFLFLMITGVWPNDGVLDAFVTVSVTWTCMGGYFKR